MLLLLFSGQLCKLSSVRQTLQRSAELPASGCQPQRQGRTWQTRVTCGCHYYVFLYVHRKTRLTSEQGRWQGLVAAKGQCASTNERAAVLKQGGSPTQVDVDAASCFSPRFWCRRQIDGRPGLCEGTC